MSIPSNQAKSLFLAAIEDLAPEQWPAFLEQACAGDVELSADVEKLLRAYSEMGSFHEAARSAPLATVDDPVGNHLGTVIGPYKLLQQLGEGGMGTVFMAEQSQPVQRKVALKIIRPGMGSAQVIARFEAERQALAIMDHPNIARVLDAGTIGDSEPRTSVSGAPQPLTDVRGSGRPYFVMELVKGIPITAFCDQYKLTTRQRLELFIPVCQAIQHAHMKGIIHRDVKPSNVLIALYDGKPVPKVIDFGVAKAMGEPLTQRTLFTQVGQIVGTFEYMSPEQATLNQLDIDTRSDIYSLGVLLYELLTGVTPLDKERLRTLALDQMLRTIREEEPMRPSARLSSAAGALAVAAAYRGGDSQTLVSQLRGELDWIVMRGLEKERARRYDTANALARDVERYLKDEPVEACPPSAGYRLRKFARKNRKVLATLTTFIVLLLLGIAGSTWQAVRATQAEAVANENAVQAQEKEQEANKERDVVKALNVKLEAALKEIRATQDQLRSILYASRMNLAQYAWEAGDIERLRALLELQRPKMGETDLRNFEWHYFNRLCHSDLLTLKHSEMVYSVAYSRDGKRLATVSADRKAQVKVWDGQTGKELLSFKAGEGLIFSVAIRPDGKRLATPWSKGGKWVVKEWDAETGKELRTFQEPVDQLTRLAYSPDGKRLAAEQKRQCVVWDTESGKELFTLKRHTGDLLGVAFTSDGKRLATASFDKTVKVWDAANGKELRTLELHTDRIMSVAFSPDGKEFATYSPDQPVKVWDAATGEELRTLQGPTNIVMRGDMAYSPDGKRLASSWADGSVRLWDAVTDKPLFTIRGHSKPIVSMAFSPDGKHLASASIDATVKVWDALTGQEPLTLEPRLLPMGGAVVSPDGKHVAISGSGAKIWDIQTGKELELKTLKEITSLRNKIITLAFSPDGKRLVARARIFGQGISYKLKVLDLERDEELVFPEASRVAFSPNGNRLAATTLVRGDAGESYKVKILDLKTREELLSLEGGGNYSVAFSPDGKRLAGTGPFSNPARPRETGKVKVWDAKNGKELFVFEGGWGRAIFTPDGKRLAAISREEIKVWDVQTGQELRSFKYHGGRFAFSADGKRLAIANHLLSANKDVTVWDIETGKEQLTLKEYTHPMLYVAFSPDGKRLATASSKTVKVWDAQSGQELLTFRGANERFFNFNSVAFTPDGRRLVIGREENGTVKIYDATPLPEKPVPAP
jgi:WD40 repeat protein/serine/threonine protein kinase